jgi:SAM-dependent methyltransferase
LVSRDQHSVMHRTLYSLRKRLYLLKKRLSAMARNFYHLTRAKLELFSLKLTYKREYGGAVVTAIDPGDEMYRFIAEHWDWPHHATPMADRAYALRGYLASGDQHVRELADVLAEAGRPLARVSSFLEFACGHGRMTRFLVHRLDRSRITVSDVNPSAVAFTRDTFGVQGFCSVEDPRNLRHDGRYEVIFVGSLFTHLTHAYWGPWLQRLYSLLSDKGLMIFSTHGLRVLDEIYGDSWKSQLETAGDGFFFIQTNETHGRLPTSYYGATFVTESYVKGFVQANALGRIEAFHPARLNFQDVYVLEKKSSNSVAASAETTLSEPTP